MLKNYFKTAWRNLWRNKFYSAINIVGLAIGLAVGIMILLWVQDEMSYDNFHHNAANIYKINSHLGDISTAQVWQRAPAPLSVFAKQIPGVQNAVRISDVEDQVLFVYKNKKFGETKLGFVDDNFFSFFNFPLLQGSKAKPFPDLHSIVISSSVAKKYFGETNNAVGKILSTISYGNVVVSGVMQDFPHNSSLQYDMLLPMSLYAVIFRQQSGNGSWKTIDEDLGSYNFKIFFQLEPDASPQAIASKVSQLYQNKKGGNDKNNFFTLQPLPTLHLIAADGSKSKWQMVNIFLIIAILILVIASINYVNLSTARSLVRAKEVSIRKIIGAGKFQLFMQFMVETAVLFLLSSLLALLIIYLLLPLYNTLSGKQLVFDIGNGNIWLVISSTIIGALLLASFYPALLLSSFQPVAALKGKLSLALGTTSFRKVLVVVQFTFSVALIIGTIVIYKQLRYVKEKDLGYDKEQVFAFQLTGEATRQYDAIRTELLKQPGVLDVATSTDNIVGYNATTNATDWDGKDPNNSFLIHPGYIDEKFIPFFKMKMIAGSNFSSWPADSAHFIVNETAVKKADITNPVGKRFQLYQTKGIITGVIKDFNYTSLKQPVEPMIFMYNPFNWEVFIKTTGKAAKQAVTAAQNVWTQFDKTTPFQYSFLDDDYNKIYESDEKMSALINAFAAIAILLSCLGLFGLIAFSAQVKTKEIGIRKVLGADVMSIITLLGKEFIELVLIAFLIASPVAWYAMHKWLQDFAYRITISWWMFVFAGIMAVAIALITVCFQAIKAAIANPVKSLRTE